MQNCNSQQTQQQRGTSTLVHILIPLKTGNTCQGRWPHIEDLFHSHIQVPVKEK